MSHLMMMHQPMQTYNQQPNNQFMSYPSYNPLMMSPLQQPIQPMQQPMQPQLYQMMMMNPQLNPYNQQPLNQAMNPAAAVQPLTQPIQSINQPISRPMSSAVQPLSSQSNNQTNNQTNNQPVLMAQSIPQPASPSSDSAPAPSEVRVSFSSMLSHPRHPSVVYFQLRADGHNQDLIIEHPSGWLVVRPEAHFVEHLVNQMTNARIAREKWPMPSPMQLLFKSCDTSRLLPERTVTRFTVARGSQMEWKEAMKAVKSLKDEEVVRAKMRVSFGLLRAGEALQPPVVAYESVILLGWRTTRSSAKRRQMKLEQDALLAAVAASQQLTNPASHSSSNQTSNSSSVQSSNQLFGQSDSLYGPVPDLILEPVDSAVSTPSSSGSAMMNNSLGHISVSSLNNRTINQAINQAMNKRAREVSQQIHHAAENIDDLIRPDLSDEQSNKRAKLFSDGLVKRPSPIRRASNQSINQSIK